jgi:adenylate kinase family enzyme
MLALGEGHADYVSSGILSQKIKDYNSAAKDLLPFLKEKVGGAFTEINTQRLFSRTIEDVRKYYEPCVIHIRPGPDAQDAKKDITEGLSGEHGFVNLDINSLIRYETERRTAIGQEMHAMVQGSKIIPAEMIVRMLKLIIYNGQPHMNKFILTSFPDIIEQAKEFETQCAKITAIIYTTKSEGFVEIKNNSLSLFNIDSMFQKEFRLKVMNSWNYDIFKEKLGDKIEFGLVAGQSLAGKTELAGYLSKSLGMKLIDLNAVNAKIIKQINDENPEEPFEGELAPLDKIEADVSATVKMATAGGAKAKFVFDGYALTHKTADATIKFLSTFGVPEFMLNLSVSKEALALRYCAKNEKDAVGEDDEPVI